MRKLINFFRNIYLFRKDLCNHNGFDAIDSLGIFNTSLKEVHKKMESSNRFHYGKRTKALGRTIALIDKVISHDYSEEVRSKISVQNDGETSFGKDVSSKLTNLSVIIKESIEAQNKDWSRIFALIKSYNYGIRSWWL